MNDVAWVRWLTERAQPGQQVIDIGANVGAFTFPLASKVGPSGHVWAIEPGLVAAQQLEKRARLEAPNVTVIHAAVADREDYGVLFLAPKDHRHNSLYLQAVQAYTEGPQSIQPVEIMRLDRMWRRGDLPRHADWIKVDTQGAEGAVLSRAGPYLADRETGWMIEWWPYGLECGGWTNAGLAEVLQGFGLSCFTLDVYSGALAEVPWPKALQDADRRKTLNKAMNLGFAHKGSSKWPIR